VDGDAFLASPLQQDLQQVAVLPALCGMSGRDLATANIKGYYSRRVGLLEQELLAKQQEWRQLSEENSSLRRWGHVHPAASHHMQLCVCQHVQRSPEALATLPSYMSWQQHQQSWLQDNRSIIPCQPLLKPPAYSSVAYSTLAVQE
jgi:hypothetical protein